MIRLVTLTALVACSCAAPEAPSLDRGTRRTALDLSVTSTETDIEGGGTVDEDTIRLGGDIGWLVAPRTEVGATGAFLDAESDDGVDEIGATVLSLGPYARYYFTTDGRVIPFVDARIAYASGELEVNGASADGDGFEWALGLGFMSPLSSSVAIETTARYARADIELDDVDLESDGVAFLIGISAFF